MSNTAAIEILCGLLSDCGYVFEQACDKNGVDTIYVEIRRRPYRFAEFQVINDILIKLVICDHGLSYPGEHYDIQLSSILCVSVFSLYNPDSLTQIVKKLKYCQTNAEDMCMSASCPHIWDITGVTSPK